MSASDCIKDLECIDKNEALRLKIAAILSILASSALGVAIPLFAKNFSKTKVFFAGQCFAAGVILATGFVHILPDAFEALGNPCLAQDPWGKFPFAGFIAMLASMVTLLLDSLALGYFFHRAAATGSTTTATQADHAPHSHAHHIVSVNLEEVQRVHAVESPQLQSSTAHSHVDSHNDVKDKIRKKVIAQVLEFGILAHSVIIGISMGASNSPCTVRPLLGALIFHQLFEGLALGGCISLGDFKKVSKMLMSLFFTLTTPGGIAIGIAIASGYNENDPKSLMVQGLFDAMSAGILVYMALVDLLSSHFLNEDFLRKSALHYAFAYTFLFLGAGSMSVLAIWA